MKIAVTYDNGEVFQHFGHAEQFKVYEIEDGKVASSKVLGSNGQGHGALSALLSENKIDALICGGIGGGARQALSEYGIELYPGVQGGADEAVEALLAGSLDYNPNTVCAHHHGDEGHSCGSHSCGADKHGCAGN